MAYPPESAKVAPACRSGGCQAAGFKVLNDLVNIPDQLLQRFPPLPDQRCCRTAHFLISLEQHIIFECPGAAFLHRALDIRDRLTGIADIFLAQLLGGPAAGSLPLDKRRQYARPKLG